MFNPNSAFPRLTTYTPYAGHEAPPRAINAIDWRARAGAQMRAMPSTQDAVNRIASTAMRSLDGGGTASATMDIFARKGLLDVLGDPRHSQRSMQQAQATSARVDEAVEGVFDSTKPVAGPPAPFASLFRPSVDPAVRAQGGFNETITASARHRGSGNPTVKLGRAPKRTDPNQTTLF